MAKQSINIGTVANDGTGTTIRDGGDLINDNFNEIYTAIGDGSTLSIDVSGATANQTLIYNDSTSKFEPGAASGYTFLVDADSGSTQTIDNGNTLNLNGGSGITSIISGTDTVSIAIDSTVATLTGSQTLTNKTLTTPVISSISNTGTLTLPTSTDTLVGRATTDTLTNKTLSGASNTLSNIGNGSLSNSTITVTGDSGTQAIDLGDTLTITGSGTVTTSQSGDTLTITGTAFTGGSDLDQAGADIQDIGYISHRSPDSTITQTLTVTVATKTTEHTAYGDGSANGYLIDGHEGAHVQLSRGTYKFDQADSTNASHPLRFYYDENKNIEFTTGVTNSGTPGSAGAYTQIVIDDDTPTPLFYQCTAHAQMGGRIDVMGGKRARLNITTDKSNTGNGSTTGFTILANRTVDDILVFVNGICLVPTDDYTISSTTLTFTTAPANGAEIVFRYLG